MTINPAMIGAAAELPICPLVGEMGGSPEGGAQVYASPKSSRAAMSGPSCYTAPPSSLQGISPTRGESGSFGALAITAETPADVPAREALLDRAMGPGRKRKSSEKLRRGRRPSEGLAFCAKDADGRLLGTVRLWDVTAGEGGAPALLLGPLAVDPSVKSTGIGSALMRRAIGEARRLGHGAILLVGDAPYYARFGFSAGKTDALSMPGPYEKSRFLALELIEGWLDGARGTLMAAGRRAKAERRRMAA